MLNRLLGAVVVFVLTWLVLWIVAEILGAVPTAPTAWLSGLLDAVAVWVALLCGVLYFWQGESWTTRWRR